MLLTLVGFTNFKVKIARKRAGGLSTDSGRLRREEESIPHRRKITGSVSRRVAEFLFIFYAAESKLMSGGGGNPSIDRIGVTGAPFTSRLSSLYLQFFAWNHNFLSKTEQDRRCKVIPDVERRRPFWTDAAIL